MKETGKREEGRVSCPTRLASRVLAWAGRGTRPVRWMIALFALLGAMPSFGATPTMYPYELPAKAGKRDQALHCQKAADVLAKTGKLELGVWYTGWATCKKYSEDNKIPVIFIWSNHGCIHCWYTDSSFMRQEFLDWKESKDADADAAKVIYCFMAGGESECPDDKQGGAAYDWMWKTPSKIGAFPFVTLYWPKNGEEEPGAFVMHKTGDDFCGTKVQSENTYPERVESIIANMKSAFAGWHPPEEYSYAGGWFTQTNYPYATPQAESTTEFVDVRLRRASVIPTNQVLKVSGGKLAAAVDLKVDWATNVVERTFKIEKFTDYFKAGSDVVLQLMGKDKEGKDAVMSETKVYCFKADEEKPSAANPRSPVDPVFNFGEWTMNFDAATNKVGQTPGAYTLVLLAGSLWCPDCYNVDHNFLDVKDQGGNNRFEKWAAEKNVALVMIDLPLDGQAAPTLLSREEGIGYFDKDGNNVPVTKSGVGYLTRKNIPDSQDGIAKTYFDRNVKLARTNTYEGGFHRPEDVNSYRPGVPTFVLLRGKDHSAVARLTQMSVGISSPKSSADFDKILERFNEMIEMDANPTEIENNYPSASNTLKLEANGGSDDARISHTDPADVFRLEGMGGNARQSVEVTGTSDAEVVVSFLALDSTGEVKTLACATNTLKNGLALTNVFTHAGDCFVEVKARRGTFESGGKKGEDFVSECLRLTHDGSTFQNYTIKAELVSLVPQEDRVTAVPKAGERTLNVEFVSNAVYRLVGLDTSNLNPALKPVEGLDGFYRAQVDGLVKGLALADQGGGKYELEYQKWVAGTVGFEGRSREVDKSDCDMTGRPIEIPVVRSAKSGSVDVTVVINTNDAQYATLFKDGRIWLTNGTDRVRSVLHWDDGDEAVKNVKVWIEDDILDWDELSRVLLTITNVTSEVDVEGYRVTPDEAATNFTLMVSAVITGSSGSVVIDDVEPGFARGTTVYVREGEGLTLTASRVGGNARLVAALLDSSYKGAVFETADPRDLTAIEDEFPSIVDQPFYEQLKMENAHFLWWANRETNDKSVRITFPGLAVGKTARIRLMALEPLENAGDYGTLTVYIVGKDVPGFVKPVGAFDATDYMAVDQTFALTNVAAGDKTVRFSKMSGTLPSGLKVSYDETIPAMRIAGITKAKAGAYPVSYVVSKKVDGKTVTGTTLSLDITVYDLKQMGPNGEQPNPIVMKASRTFKGIAVIDPANSNMVGTLQVTVPPSGKASARFTGADGTVSFSAKGWTVRQTDGTLETDLEMRRGETTLHLAADPDGGITAQFEGGEMNGFAAYTAGKVWSKLSPADAWAGQYTVALVHTGVASEDAPGLAPTGNGWMSLKMTKSAARKGTFTAKGWLPNGTKFSGSYTLQLMDREGEAAAAYLPVFYRSSRNVLAALAEIDAGACGEEMPCDSIRAAQLEIEIGGEAKPVVCGGCWTHREPAKDKAGYEVRFDLRGACYNEDRDLRSCLCETKPTDDVKAAFHFNGKKYDVTIKAHDIKSDDSALTLEFEPSNGTISGSADGTAYSGIVVIGDIGCPCGPSGEVEYLTFAYGGAAESGKPVTIEPATPSGN